MPEISDRLKQRFSHPSPNVEEFLSVITGESEPQSVHLADPCADERLRGLAEIMEDLPVGQREVLMLRFADGLSLAEIAEAIQIPLGTVKSRLHGAIESLRGDERSKKYFEP